MPAHHAEGIPTSPADVGISKETGWQSSALIVSLITAFHTMLLTSGEKKQKHPTDKDLPTVELDWTNLFLPSLSERNRSH